MPLLTAAYGQRLCTIRQSSDSVVKLTKKTITLSQLRIWNW
jgi:hypothetical protein